MEEYGNFRHNKETFSFDVVCVFVISEKCQEYVLLYMCLTESFFEITMELKCYVIIPEYMLTVLFHTTLTL